MTTDHDTEPTEHDRHDAEAARALAPHLAGRLVPTLDPLHVAALLVGVMRDIDWRPIPRPPNIPDPGRRDPDGYRRGAAEARAALERALTESEGDTDG